jgi:acyl-CoA reductase-like NAD-dependent aldehyde dehydrogenase
VVLVISPWNYPFFLSMAPLVSAVAAGNSAILKPASQTPGTGEICAKVFKKAGFPKDLVQTVTGSGSVTGELLIKNKDIDMYFFTGSTGVGKKVFESAAGGIKPCTLELGGNDPLIILRTADIDRAAAGAVFAAYSNAGQTCIGTERVYVEAPVYDEFVKKVKELTKKIVAGPGQGPTEMGPMITKGQLKIVKKHLEEAEKRGAKTTRGKSKGPADQYIPATCLTDVPPDTMLMTEETFGPLMPIVKVKDWKEAVKLSNETRYGLSSAVFGKPGGDTRRAVNEIEAGSVTVNDVMTSIANPHLPFSGIKQSGIGFYHGKEGLRTFCRIRSVMENKRFRRKPEFYWYPYDSSDYDLVKDGMKFLFGQGLGKRMGGMKKGVKMFLKLL